MIRIGKEYQASVPSHSNYCYIYRPLRQLRVWGGGEFNGSVMKKFREKFGEWRTEEDLCQLMFQYQCTWSEVLDLMAEHKVELRKNYLQRDRARV